MSGLCSLSPRSHSDTRAAPSSAARTQELDLPEDIVRDLLSLSGSDVVVIADDSSSMNSIAEPESGLTATRWDELRNALSTLITMLLVVDHADGFFLKFLNDPAWYTIKSKDELAALFAQKPTARGLTPLKASLELVCQGYGHAEMDTLLICLTDGQPSDCQLPDIQAMLQARAKSVFVSFLMCTSEDEVVSAYNRCVE